MDEDTGNPWLAIPNTYKGKFQVTPGEGVTLDSVNVMLSSDNDVTFMGNAEMASYTSGDVILTLPESCRPAVDIIALFPTTTDVVLNSGEIAVNTEAVISVPSEKGKRTEALPFNISPNGLMTCDRDLTNAIVHLAGNSYNIGVNWYREED